MSARLTRQSLAQAVYQLSQQASNQADFARQLAAYLVSEGRVKELDLLLRDLDRLQFRDFGVLEIQTTSARPLSDSIKQTIKSLFPAQTSHIRETQDAGLIGGVRVRAQDQVLDVSVRTKLRQLKQAIKV